MVPIYTPLAEARLGLRPFGHTNPESQRDSGSKPKVARHELPWENAPGTDNPNGVAAWWRTKSLCNFPARFFLFSLLFLAATFSHAADYDAQFNKWFEVQTNLQSWSGDFTQTRTLTVLNQPLITPGKVWVKPGEFRWELGQPLQTIVLRRPDELLIIYPRLKRAEKYALGTVPTGPMKDALALMDASLPRDRASMEEHFKLVSAVLTNSTLQMTLQPRSEAARKMIGQVVIGFHTNDYIIANTEMKFADGSRLQNAFTNIVLNQPFAPDLFEAKLPADYTVAEPLKQ